MKRLFGGSRRQKNKSYQLPSSESKKVKTLVVSQTDVENGSYVQWVVAVGGKLLCFIRPRGLYSLPMLHIYDIQQRSWQSVFVQIFTRQGMVEALVDGFVLFPHCELQHRIQRLDVVTMEISYESACFKRGEDRRENWLSNGKAGYLEKAGRVVYVNIGFRSEVLTLDPISLVYSHERGVKGKFPEDRFGFQTCADYDKLFLCGGRLPGGGTLSDLHVLHYTKSGFFQWSKIALTFRTVWPCMLTPLSKHKLFMMYRGHNDLHAEIVDFQYPDSPFRNELKCKNLNFFPATEKGTVVDRKLFAVGSREVSIVYGK